MNKKKRILAIIGSASSNSSNQELVEKMAKLMEIDFEWTIYNELKSLPHFDPDLSIENPPQAVLDFRQSIEKSDGIIICTPEYVFSIPSGLKNAIEWCISTTLFSHKPCGLITASANGYTAHQELQHIMKTAMAKFTDETTWLIQGIKGKLDAEGELTDKMAIEQLARFRKAFTDLVNDNGQV